MHSGLVASTAPGKFYVYWRLPDGVSFVDPACFAGRSLHVMVGAPLFLLGWAAFDSYTAAAFPDGDVSGVVSETET